MMGDRMSDVTLLSAAAAGTIKVGSFEVNRIGFGAMRITGSGVWGEPADHDNAIAVLKRAAEVGVNFIDTADAYGPEVSENLIHEALHPYDGLVIATKGGMTRGGPGDWQSDGSPKHLKDACNESLKRLGVSQIQIYQFHRPDPKVSFTDSLKALIELQDEGKIKHIGLSNVTLGQLQQALEMTEIVSVQNHYNFTHRQDSEEVLSFCEENGIAFIPYFPIGGNMGGFQQETLKAIAEIHKASVYQIALAWLLQHSPAMLPIPGTSSIEHLEQNIAASHINLTSEDIDKLDSVG